MKVNLMSVYVAGGGGTHLESRVASHYLAALVAETGARGVLGIVTALKTQQFEIDAPLDDLVIDGRLTDGTATRLDLQITTTLSFTEGDKKWQDIVPRAWDRFGQTNFNPDFAPVSPDTQAVAIWAAMNSRGERILRPECGWFSF
jgi:hypothetical protein